MDLRTNRAGRRIVTSIVLSFSLALAVGCSKGDADSAGTAIRNSESTWGDDSMRAWRDYADAVVVVDVVAEHELESPGSPDPEPSIGRSVDLVVKRDLWHRNKATTKMSVVVDGWQHSKSTGRRPLQDAHGPRVEVGETYLVPLMRLRDGSWTTFSAGSFLPVHDGAISLGERSSTSTKLLDEKSLDEVLQIFVALEPDPLVEKFAGYDPITRSQLVNSERTRDPAHPEVPTTSWAHPSKPVTGETTPR